MGLLLLGAAVTLAVATVYGQNATYCPGDSVCYAVNVPSSGSASSIFFQIRGPSKMSWIGLGQGGLMAGSNIFVIYANAAGKNVTLSSRLGTGESQPQSSTSAEVTLLDGSGIMNGMMTANVKCTNCQSWQGGTMDFTSSSASWIYAYKEGDPIMSDSVSANIAFHDHYGPFTFNLAEAAAGDGTLDPFTHNLASANSGNSTTTPSNNTGGNFGSASESVSNGMTAVAAHGILGAIAFLFIFPAGSVVLRLLNHHSVLWVHVMIQLLGYITALALMETGVWIAVTNEELSNAHPIIGLVVVCGLFIQPFLGLAHHLCYKKYGRRNAFTQPHIWWGRILITLGIINGGLGLQLAGADLGMIVAYGCVGGVSWTVWMGVAALTWWRAYVDGQKGDVKPHIVMLRNDEDPTKWIEMTKLDQTR